VELPPFSPEYGLFLFIGDKKMSKQVKIFTRGEKYRENWEKIFKKGKKAKK